MSITTLLTASRRPSYRHSTVSFAPATPADPHFRSEDHASASSQPNTPGASAGGHASAAFAAAVGGGTSSGSITPSLYHPFNSGQKLEIQLENDTLVLRGAGPESTATEAVLSGNVVLTLTEATKIGTIMLELTGKAKVTFSEGATAR